MSSIEYFKVVVTALAAIAYWRAFTPPTPSTQMKDAPIDGIFGRMIRHMAFISKLSVCLAQLCQIVLLLALIDPIGDPTIARKTLQTVCPNPTSTNMGKLRTKMIQLPPSLLIGYSLMISMAALRVWCFRSLKRFFTYEITIQKSHKLIQTGPYAYVRHPSYTAQILLTAGVYITAFSSSTWISECQVNQGPAFYIFWSYIGLSAFGMYKLYTRGDIEDRELHKAFGEEWVRYSKEVPYQFVPGLL
ncbi:hypothetical protein CPC08DRAFT_698048 [Agrocybe pediades]|nr:hypothetical protein CPC08DRAFT_698048 [Agrocybe pediades]